MRKLLSLLLLMPFTSMASMAFAQVDTIYTHTQVIPCDIKEITETAAIYSYPKESFNNSASLNTICKIKFRNGRVQKFAAQTSFKQLSSPLEWALVSLTTVESEIHGLYRLGDVSSKAKGTTEFSSQERVKQRALDKIKIQAAILGGNIIFISNMRSEGNKSGFWEDTSSETSLMGIVYANKLIPIEIFLQRTANKKTFPITTEIYLKNSNTRINHNNINNHIDIKSIREEGGMVMIDGDIPHCDQHTFRVSYLDKYSFYVAYKTRQGVFSFKMQL
ncbi:MAG: hypothetical protein RR285_11805 [Acinetobacter sp.]